MDVEGVTIPGRMVIGKYCPWKYQGHALNEEGGCTWPLDSRGRFFDETDTLITRDISTISANLALLIHTIKMTKLKQLRTAIPKYGKLKRRSQTKLLHLVQHTGDV